ncbi:MAG: cadmium-translocating P-type ATPase [Deltaproteobacteria bacterium]|nr:cadmium-translocating P-type ATPase [Deltaproteobacteria bacterium]
MKEEVRVEGFEGPWWRHPPMRNALAAGVLTGTAFVLGHFGTIGPFVEIPVYVIAILLGGYHWAREGIEELVEEREIGIEILMIAATVGSAVLGMWDEAAFLVVLYGVAEGLEEFSYAKTRHSIRKLLDLAPKEARVLKDGQEVTVSAEDLSVGDVFVVRPGESIPTDGVIIRGRSSINEAPVSGESIPVEKLEGDRVLAATINQEGALEIKTTAAFKDNTLSKMIYLVEEAQEEKGKTQLFIEKFGKIYSPLVLLSAFLLIIVPALLDGASISYWATRAVVLLVAAAPCALVMSTPVAIAAGIGKAGKSGILIKGGIHLENLGKIKAVAFDKTGTLTKGKPVVTDILVLGENESDILRLAYSVEKNSEHPLATAIVRKAEEAGIRASEVTDFTAITGDGAKAKVGDKTIYVGKPDLFTSLGKEAQTIPQIEKLRNEGKTVILVGTNEEIYGIIAIQDEVRPQAKGVVQKLKGMGVKVLMLTGDSKVTARAIAGELGIDDVRADLKPQDKIKFIKELENRYGAVAMVGDGINDAPALATATVGIAMGTGGTDAAIEAADIALMADDLTRVPYAIHLGKRARRISSQNIVFSLVVLVTLIPMALIGAITIAAAVFFHEASELLAVANGLRVAKRG